MSNNISDELREFINKDESRHLISNKSQLLESRSLERNFKPTKRIPSSSGFTFNGKLEDRITKFNNKYKRV